MILPDDTPESPTKVQRELADTARTTNPSQEPSPPAYSGYPSYQHGHPQPYPVPSSSALLPVSHQTVVVLSDARERAIRRFLRAFLWAVLIWALAGMFMGSLIEIARPKRGKDPDFYTPGWPERRDGVIHRCISNQDPWSTSGVLPVVSFELPIASEVLYLFARGSLASGNVMIRQDPTLIHPDMMTVDVIVSHRTSETTGLVSVCSMERSPGQRGIGFFTPVRWRSTTHPMVEFTVVVRLPVSSDNKPLHIPAFETDLPHFAHHVDRLQGKIEFNSLSMSTTNSHINAVSVQAANTMVRTTNGHIVGNYTSSTELTLTTSNGLISVNVKLHNAASQNTTKLLMRTTNAHLTSYIDLISDAPDHRGGAFDVSAQTTNDPLSLGFPLSPSSAHLTVVAKTTNSPATVSLNRQYEGGFRLQSTNSDRFVHFKDDAEDPEGKERQRIVTIRRRIKNLVEGSTTWGPNEDTKSMGYASLQTTNSPVSLILL